MQEIEIVDKMITRLFENSFIKRSEWQAWQKVKELAQQPRQPRQPIITQMGEWLPCSRLADCSYVRIKSQCKGIDCEVYDPT